MQKIKNDLSNTRISGDTSVKHHIRNGLYDNSPMEIQNKISSTNKHRRENESDTKYVGCKVAQYINEEQKILKQIGESANAKQILNTYLVLSDVYHDILNSVNGIKNWLRTKNKN